MKKRTFEIFEEQAPPGHEQLIMTKASAELASRKQENALTRRWFLWLSPALVMASAAGFWFNQRKKTDLNETAENNFVQLSYDLSLYDQLDLVSEIDNFEIIEYIDDIEEDDWGKV